MRYAVLFCPKACSTRSTATCYYEYCCSWLCGWVCCCDLRRRKRCNIHLNLVLPYLWSTNNFCHTWYDTIRANTVHVRIRTNFLYLSSSIGTFCVEFGFGTPISPKRTKGPTAGGRQLAAGAILKVCKTQKVFF